MSRTNLKDYMNLPLDSRQNHLNLSEDCLEIGANSGGNRALLAMHLNTTCESLGMKTGYLCHACHNDKCSNVGHLYWGTAKENNHDRNIDHPDLYKRIKKTIIERHGPNHFKKVGSLGRKGWKSNKPASVLSSEEVEKRLTALKESGIDIFRYGWVTKVASLWGISHTQVRRFFESYWEGPAPYRKSV